MPPDDPPCPECGEPVGAVPSGCASCGADLDRTDDGVVETAVVDLGNTSGDDAGTDRDGGVAPERRHASTATGAVTREDAVEGERGWFPFDSPWGTAATAATGVAAGIAVGGLLAALLHVAANDVWARMIGGVAAVGTILYTTRARTVSGTFRRACLLIAALVAVAPTIWFAGDVGVNDLTGRVLLFAATELVAVPTAVLVAGFGRRVAGGKE